MFANRYSNLTRLASLLIVLSLGTAGQAAAQVAVSLPDVQGVTGSSVTVDVSVGDLSGRNISGYQFEIQYDPNVVEFTGLSSSGTLSGGLTTLSNSPSTGVFRVVGAGASALSGSGTLIRLTGTFVAEGSTNLTWNEFSFDNAGVSAVLDGGSASVTDQIAVIDVAVSNVNGRPGTQVSIPVSVGNLSGLEVPGYSFNLTWDPAVLTISGVSTSGTISAGRNVQATFPASGSMVVQDIDASWLDGSGTLLYLTAQLETAGTTALDITTFTFDRDGVDALAADGLAMSINVAPQFTSTPVTLARAGIRYEYLAVAVDGDGDAITLGAPTKPTWASFQDNGDGTGLLYGVPGAGATGVHNVTLTASDPYGVTGMQKFSISVVPNGVPVAVNDEVATPRGIAVEIDVTANDTDPDGDALTLQSVAPPDHGSTSITTDGTILYTPQPLYVGTDTFTYRISDGMDTDQATVTVSMENAPPAAADDEADVFAGDDIVVDLLANDTDANGDALSITDVSDPAEGTLTDNGDGTITYSAPAQYDGVDTFEYTVSDVFGATDQANVIVTVNGPGVDGDFVDEAVEDGAPNGGDGNDDGTPDADQSNVASFAIVDGPNTGKYLTLEVEEGLTLARVQSIPNPSPQDAPEASYPLAFLSFFVEGLEPGAAAEVTLHVPDAVELTGFVRYGPTMDNPDDHWYDFWYDGSTGARIDPGTILLTYLDGGRGDDDLAADGVIVDAGAPVARENQTPVAVDDSAETNEDAAVVIDVLANDYDVDLDGISIAMLSDGSYGDVDNQGDGTLLYTPDPDFFGTDTFSYTVTDGMFMSEPATVTVNVLAVDDPPVAVDDHVTTFMNTVVDILVFENDYDPDGAFYLAAIGQPQHGTATFLGNGVVRYAPETDYLGEDSFVYSIGDGSTIDQAMVAISVVASTEAPVAVDDHFMTDEDTSVLIDVLANDMDPNGDPLSVDSFTQPPNGSVVFGDGGLLQYTPDADFFGDDTFSYTITDDAITSTADVTVQIAPVNDAPYFPGSDWLMAPDDGAHIVLTGDPDLPVELEWPIAMDPDGDQVRYRLQIAHAFVFEQQYMLFEKDMGSQTQFTYRQGDLAQAMTALGVELNESRQLYFRVEVDDGQARITSQITTCSVIRGSITDIGRSGDVPSEVVLSANYPNPFNPETTIRYALPDARHVRLAVYDMLGSEVSVLEDGVRPAGHHRVTFDARTLPSGTYVYRLAAGDQVLTRTLTLLK